MDPTAEIDLGATLVLTDDLSAEGGNDTISNGSKANGSEIEGSPSAPVNFTGKEAAREQQHPPGSSDSEKPEEFAGGEESASDELLDADAGVAAKQEGAEGIPQDPNSGTNIPLKDDRAETTSIKLDVTKTNGTDETEIKAASTKNEVTAVTVKKRSIITQSDVPQLKRPRTSSGMPETSIRSRKQETVPEKHRGKQTRESSSESSDGEQSKTRHQRKYSRSTDSEGTRDDSSSRRSEAPSGSSSGSESNGDKSDKDESDSSSSNESEVAASKRSRKPCRSNRKPNNVAKRRQTRSRTPSPQRSRSRTKVSMKASQTSQPRRGPSDEKAKVAAVKSSRQTASEVTPPKKWQDSDEFAAWNPSDGDLVWAAVPRVHGSSLGVVLKQEAVAESPNKLVRIAFLNDECHGTTVKQLIKPYDNDKAKEMKEYKGDKRKLTASGKEKRQAITEADAFLSRGVSLEKSHNFRLCAMCRCAASPKFWSRMKISKEDVDNAFAVAAEERQQERLKRKAQREKRQMRKKANSSSKNDSSPKEVSLSCSEHSSDESSDGYSSDGDEDEFSSEKLEKAKQMAPKLWAEADAPAIAYGNPALAAATMNRKTKPGAKTRKKSMSSVSPPRG